MLFESRIKRARRLQREQRDLPADDNVPAPDAVERPALREEMERGDLFAMLVAGLYTVFLPAAAVLLLVVCLACAIFFH